MAEVASNVVDGLERTERIVLSGHVQGVGFRPFVYRLAKKHGLTGHVRNQLGEVEVVATGPAAELIRFENDLIDRAPPLSKPAIDSVDVVDYQHFDGFEIRASSASEKPRIFVPQDFFMCDECRAELNDPDDLR